MALTACNIFINHIYKDRCLVRSQKVENHDFIKSVFSKADFKNEDHFISKKIV
jgi:hypothetical protein